MNKDIKIFISYRRADNACFAERIRDWFTLTYKRENVFMDFDAIPPFVDFEVFIIEQIKKVDVMLVIIGKEWLDILKQRLASGEVDYVRLEIREGIQHGKLVAPILVDGANPPDADDLPEDIRAITRANMPRLDGGRQFLDNVQRIVEALPLALAQHLHLQAAEVAEAERMVAPVEMLDFFPESELDEADAETVPLNLPSRPESPPQVQAPPQAQPAPRPAAPPAPAPGVISRARTGAVPEPKREIAQKPVLICYAEEDGETAHHIEALLTTAGINVKADEDNLTEDEVRKAGLVLFLLSPASKRTAVFHAEIATAQRTSTPILPVLIEGDSEEVAPFSLALNQMIDLRDFDAQWENLVMSVRMYMG